MTEVDILCRGHKDHIVELKESMEHSGLQNFGLHMEDKTRG